MGTFDGTLPYCKDSPAGTFQHSLMFPVILFVADNFGAPKLLVGLGPFEEMTSMTMPKTTVDDKHSVIAREYKIRGAWQSSVVF